jgi:hypothetical protein
MAGSVGDELGIVNNELRGFARLYRSVPSCFHQTQLKRYFEPANLMTKETSKLRVSLKIHER